MHRALAAFALSALVGLAACGSDDSKQRYAQDVNSAQSRLTQTFANLQTRISNLSEPERDAAVLREYETAVGKAVAELRAIDPPGGVEQLHADLVKLTGSYRAAIAEARAALAGGSAREVVKAQVDLTTGITQITGRINDATTKINKQLR